MSVGSALAEEEEEEDDAGAADMSEASNSSDHIQFKDFLDQKAAKEEMDKGTMSTPMTKASGWGTFAIYLILAIYFGKCFLMAFSGDPDKMSTGRLGFVLGIVLIIAFMVCSTTAFDALSWDYS
jgi:hypothetical protein